MNQNILRNNRQGHAALLKLLANLMSLLQRVCKSLGILGLAVAAPALVLGQSTNYVPQGGEFAPAGSLPGDQTQAALSLNANGGYLVWQDNVTDGSGLGISAIQLNSSFSSPFGAFRINQQGTNDQENPQVALLQKGGAVFVWQGGAQGFQHIYARFLSSSNTFLTGDVKVNTATNHYQANPVIATLTNGNVVVAYGSYGQDNADGLQGVYAQIVSPHGTNVGSEFLVNQFTPYNQRTPAIAAFPNGNFIIVWVSEQERVTQTISSNGIASVYAGGTNSSIQYNGFSSVDIYAQLYNSSGTRLGNEFLVNTGNSVCANPSVAAASDGSFIITWGQKDTVILNNSWDVFARSFSSAGVGGTVQLVNTQQYGDQYAPRISSIGTEYLVVWTSMGQDGSREGVFGQYLLSNGSHDGGEFRVNTTVVNAQKFQTVASDGSGRFLVAWSSFVGGVDSMDLYAQSYIKASKQPLPPPGAPMVMALDESSLTVTWPPVTAFNVAYYDLYVDGSTKSTAVTNIMWSNQGYSPSTTHTFQLAYVLTNGTESPLSATASGNTWGPDLNNDGLPDNWQALYWGNNSANWPPSGTVLVPGVTVLKIFQWGANPLDPKTWLRTWMNHTSEGWFLNWNTVQGGIYQVKFSSDLIHWTNQGSPRYAAGDADSIYVGMTDKGYYQIVRYRY